MTSSPPPGQPEFGRPADYGQPHGYGQPASPEQPTRYGEPAGFTQPETYFANIEPYEPPSAPEAPPAPPFFYPHHGFLPTPVQRQNAMAVISMVLSLVALPAICLAGIGSVIGFGGAVVGHIALSQIDQTGEKGRSQALTGIIVGYVAAAFGVLFVLLMFIGRSGN